jgi:predicted methyltransferase
MRLNLISTLLAVSSLTLAPLAVAEHHDITEQVNAAMLSDVRMSGDTARDANRKPAETLAFFGLANDMQVLELVPGGGWYTKILAPVLQENGQLYVSIFTDRVSEGLLTEDGFEDVIVIEQGVETTRTGPFNTRDINGDIDFGVTDLDLVVTFRNMHNFTAAARMQINDAVYYSLASGGLYGVIDHSRRNMSELTSETRRRTDVVEILKEVQASGFVLVDYSDLHYRPNDDLTLEVGDSSVTGQTDRFTLLFRKP